MTDWRVTEPNAGLWGFRDTFWRLGEFLRVRLGTKILNDYILVAIFSFEIRHTVEQCEGNNDIISLFLASHSVTWFLKLRCKIIEADVLTTALLI